MISKLLKENNIYQTQIRQFIQIKKITYILAMKIKTDSSALPNFVWISKRIREYAWYAPWMFLLRTHGLT